MADNDRTDKPGILYVSGPDATEAFIAAAFACERGEPASIFVAGTESAEVDPLAYELLSGTGRAGPGCEPGLLSDFFGHVLDIVITLGPAVADQCPIFPGNPERVNWAVSDIGGGKGQSGAPEVTKAAVDGIRKLVDDFFDHGYFAALLEAGKCSNLILDNISDGIIAHDTERRIFYFNNAAEKITGLQRSEVLGRDCHEAFDGGFCGGRCVYDTEPVPAYDGRNVQAEILVKNGEKRKMDMHYRNVRDPEGNTVGLLVSFRDITREVSLARKVGQMERFSGIVGRDEKMLEVFDLIRELADTEVPVFIQGESGTGKELVAAAIHNEGPRANRQFVPVNCGALPEALLESELFGHVKGAFTGAVRDKKGRFELADGGTIFLDEVGDISPAMQIKLLRVLQEGKFERVGSEKTMEADVRIISATNKDIEKEIDEGRFREDLFYRLNVVPVTLPPLRYRRNDISLLVEDALQRFVKSGRRKPEVTPEALDAMLAYDWPGNVRELHNWIQFALVKSKGKDIKPEHLPPGRRQPAARTQPRRKGKLDAGSIREALRQTKGNKVEAAKLLGVSRATLYRALKETGEM
jgi:PAS domain S-box-containing protein